jgi:hypothetical protein
MSVGLKSINLKEIFKEFFFGLENWCKNFNQFSKIFFKILKYVFVSLLFIVGILIKLRGIYFNNRVRESENKSNEKDDFLNKIRLIVGIIYIFIAFGILGNFLIYFLMLILDPIPDRLIFSFINFGEKIDPFFINRISDIDKSLYPHEKTIYYSIAFGSLIAVIHLSISCWFLIIKSHPSNHRKNLIHLISSLGEGILFGFTTFLPFFV